MLGLGQKPNDAVDVRSVLFHSDFLSTTDMGIVVFTTDGVISACNDAACFLLGSTRQDLIGTSCFDPRWHVVHRDGSPFSPSELPGARPAGEKDFVARAVLGIDLPGQSRRWLEANATSIKSSALEGVVTAYRDVTDEVRREQVLALLGSINAFITLDVNETDLLQSLCDTLVRQNGYALAWIGLAPLEGDDVSPLVASGAVDFLYPGIVSASPTKATGVGAVGRALRTGRTQVVQDLANDPLQDPWAQRTRNFGFRSAVAVPFLAGRQAVLTICDEHVSTFDDLSVSGLTEIMKYVELGIAHVASVRERDSALRHAMVAVHAQREAEVATQDITRRFDLAFEYSMAPTLFTDHDDIVLAVNQAFCSMIGRSSELLIGSNVIAFVHPDDVKFVDEAHRRLKSGELDQVRYVKRYVHADGHIVIAEVLKSRAADVDGRLLYYVRSERDVTDQQTLATQLAHQALHDPLTGLANRALLEDRLEQAHARSLDHGLIDAVFLFDLDDFRGVNDVHGHLVGDDILTAVAHRLESLTRPTDTLSRFGGDEFLYLAEGVASARDAEMILQELLASLESPFDVRGLHVHQRASVGVAIWDSADITQSVLLQRADVALSQAKSAGRARWATFTPDMAHEALTRFTIAQDLVLALESSQISMYYQPLVSLDSLNVVGFEALMRWRHPQRGFIAPNVFIPIAESSQLILELGEFALREALSSLAQWDELVPGAARPYMSVNVSARQFHDANFLDTIHRALDESGVAPQRLVLEVTESVTLINTEEFLNVMREIQRLQIGLALDDFGTGYSSLSYLAQLSPGYIKIDRSFVNPPTDHDNADALLELIITLGQRMGVVTLAEGIETRSDLVRLRAMGCELGQGFLFSPAVPAADAAQMLSGPFLLSD